MTPNERRSNETFKQYRGRLRALRAAERHKQPRVLWDSHLRGTYVSKLHGPLK